MSVAPLVSAYLTHLRAEGKSPKTVDWHRHCLTQFARWMEAHGHPADPEQWTPALIRAYLAHLGSRPKADGHPLTPTSVNSMTAP